MKQNFSTKELVHIGIFSSFVFIFSYISITIPLGTDTTRLHLGNVMCILSGLVLGAKKGGFSAGIGSFFFDLSNPLFVNSAPFTLIFKFFIGYLSGKICNLKNNKGLNVTYNIIGGVIGSTTYVILYLSKSFISNFLVGMELNANLVMLTQKFFVSFTNGIIAVLFAVPISIAINKNNIIKK